MFEHDHNHVERGLSRLLEQFKGLPVIEALVRIYSESVQELEDTFRDLYLQRFLDNAEGAQLVKIGKRVGEEQKGRTDEVFRLWIRARIRSNLSFGRALDIQEVLLLLSDAAFTYTEYPPASFVVEYSDVIADELHYAIANIIKETRAAGIAGTIVFSTRSDAFLLGFIDTTDTMHGMSSSNETSGGYLSTIVST